MSEVKKKGRTAKVLKMLSSMRKTSLIIIILAVLVGSVSEASAQTPSDWSQSHTDWNNRVMLTLFEPLSDVSFTDYMVRVNVTNLTLTSNCTQELRAVFDGNGSNATIQTIVDGSGAVQGSQWCEVIFYVNRSDSVNQLVTFYHNNSIASMPSYPARISAVSALSGQAVNVTDLSAEVSDWQYQNLLFYLDGGEVATNIDATNHEMIWRNGEPGGNTYAGMTIQGRNASGEYEKETPYSGTESDTIGGGFGSLVNVTCSWTGGPIAMYANCTDHTFGSNKEYIMTDYVQYMTYKNFGNTSNGYRFIQQHNGSQTSYGQCDGANWTNSDTGTCSAECLDVNWFAQGYGNWIYANAWTPLDNRTPIGVRTSDWNTYWGSALDCSDGAYLINDTIDVQWNWYLHYDGGSEIARAIELEAVTISSPMTTSQSADEGWNGWGLGIGFELVESSDVTRVNEPVNYNFTELTCDNISELRVYSGECGTKIIEYPLIAAFSDCSQAAGFDWASVTFRANVTASTTKDFCLYYNNTDAVDPEYGDLDIFVWFDFESGDGMALDKGSYGNHGTLEGTPVYTSDAPRGSGYDLESSDSADTISFSGSDELSLDNSANSLFIRTKMESANQYGGLIFKRENAGDLVLGMFDVGPGSNMRLAIKDGSAEALNDMTETLGAYRSYAYSYDGTDFTVYDNGVADSSWAAYDENIPDILDNDIEWNLGDHAVGASHYWYDGIVDDVYVFNGTLSSSEILSLNASTVLSLTLDDEESEWIEEIAPNITACWPEPNNVTLGDTVRFWANVSETSRPIDDVRFNISNNFYSSSYNGSSYYYDYVTTVEGELSLSCMANDTANNTATLVGENFTVNADIDIQANIQTLESIYYPKGEIGITDPPESDSVFVEKNRLVATKLNSSYFADYIDFGIVQIPPFRENGVATMLLTYSWKDLELLDNITYCYNNIDVDPSCLDYIATTWSSLNETLDKYGEFWDLILELDIESISEGDLPVSIGEANISIGMLNVSEPGGSVLFNLSGTGVIEIGIESSYFNITETYGGIAKKTLVFSGAGNQTAYVSVPMNSFISRASVNATGSSYEGSWDNSSYSQRATINITNEIEDFENVPVVVLLSSGITGGTMYNSSGDIIAIDTESDDETIVLNLSMVNGTSQEFVYYYSNNTEVSSATIDLRLGFEDFENDTGDFTGPYFSASYCQNWEGDEDNHHVYCTNNGGGIRSFPVGFTVPAEGAVITADFQTCGLWNRVGGIWFAHSRRGPAFYGGCHAYGIGLVGDPSNLCSAMGSWAFNYSYDTNISGCTWEYIYARYDRSLFTATVNDNSPITYGYVNSATSTGIQAARTNVKIDNWTVWNIGLDPIKIDLGKAVLLGGKPGANISMDVGGDSQGDTWVAPVGEYNVSTRLASGNSDLRAQLEYWVDSEQGNCSCSDCTLDGDDCIIPIDVYSDKEGVVFLEDLLIEAGTENQSRIDNFGLTEYQLGFNTTIECFDGDWQLATITYENTSQWWNLSQNNTPIKIDQYWENYSADSLFSSYGLATCRATVTVYDELYSPITTSNYEFALSEPEIELGVPSETINADNIFNVTYNITGYYSIDNCSLWTNFTDSWTRAAYNSSELVEGENWISTSAPKNGEYVWNIQCLGSEYWGPENYTLYQNGTVPLITACWMNETYAIVGDDVKLYANVTEGTFSVDSVRFDMGGLQYQAVNESGTWYYNFTAFESDNYSLNCSANDTVDNVFLLEDGNLTVGESPIYENCTMVPEPAYFNDTLTCSCDYYDANGDPEGTPAVRWFINSVFNTSGSNTSLSGVFNRTDNVTCGMSPYDGHVYGDETNTSKIISNYVPIFDIYSNQSILEDNTLTYDFNCSDAETDPLTFGDNTTKFDINSSGELSWTPTNDDVATWQFLISCWDGFGGNNSVVWEVEVNNTNDAPVFDEALGNQSVIERDTLLYDINCSDVDPTNDTITYTDDFAGFEINSSTGLITWNATEAYAGNQTVNITCSDGTNVTWQTFNLEVINIAPEFYYLKVDPDPPAISDNLFCNMSFTDDAVATAIEWYKNGTITSHTSQTLGSSFTGYNQNWSCCVNISNIFDWSYNCSDNVSIVGDSPPTIPTLIEPNDGGYGNPSNIYLRWNPSTDPDGLTVTYELLIDDHIAFLIPEVSEGGLSSVSYSWYDASIDEIYYWKVRAYDGTLYSSWSDVWNFTTGATCTNSIQDGDEEGIDCGGSCPINCTNFASLMVSGSFKEAWEDHCTNGVLDNDSEYDSGETDIDCGGTGIYACPRCGEEQQCQNDSDCQDGLYCNLSSGACEDNLILSHCDNHIADLVYGESDVDCGGSCDKCDIGMRCSEDNFNCKTPYICGPLDVCVQELQVDSDGQTFNINPEGFQSVSVHCPGFNAPYVISSDDIYEESFDCASGQIETAILYYGESDLEAATDFIPLTRKLHHYVYDADTGELLWAASTGEEFGCSCDCTTTVWGVDIPIPCIPYVSSCETSVCPDAPNSDTGECTANFPNWCSMRVDPFIVREEIFNDWECIQVPMCSNRNYIFESRVYADRIGMADRLLGGGKMEQYISDANQLIYITYPTINRNGSITDNVTGGPLCTIPATTTFVDCYELFDFEISLPWGYSLQEDCQLYEYPCPDGTEPEWVHIDFRGDWLDDYREDYSDGSNAGTNIRITREECSDNALWGGCDEVEVFDNFDAFYRLRGVPITFSDNDGMVIRLCNDQTYTLTGTYYEDIGFLWPDDDSIVETESGGKYLTHATWSIGDGVSCIDNSNCSSFACVVSLENTQTEDLDLSFSAFFGYVRCYAVTIGDEDSTLCAETDMHLSEFSPTGFYRLGRQMFTNFVIFLMPRLPPFPDMGSLFSLDFVNEIQNFLIRIIYWFVMSAWQYTFWYAIVFLIINRWMRMMYQDKTANAKTVLAIVLFLFMISMVWGFSIVGWLQGMMIGGGV